MKTMIERFARDTKGATTIEYALLASMLAIAVLAAVTTVSTETNKPMVRVGDTIGDVNGP
jgi:pilus assembly protein Flp/PilA